MLDEIIPSWLCPLCLSPLQSIPMRELRQRAAEHTDRDHPAQAAWLAEAVA